MYCVSPYWLFYVFFAYCLVVFFWVFEVDVPQIGHIYVFIEEAGFNPAKRRQWGLNIIGHCQCQCVEGISPCVQQLASKASSNTMPTLVPATPSISSRSWTDCMASSFRPSRMVDQNSPGMLSGIMWVSIRLLWFWWVIDHPQTIVLYLPLYFLFLNPTEFFFLHADGRSHHTHASSPGNRSCMW